MCFLHVLSAVVVMASLVLVSESLNVTISPEQAHITFDTQLDITCTADEPIILCDFAISNQRDIFGDSQEYFTRVDNEDCRFTVDGYSFLSNYVIVGCRVRTSDSDWVYAEMSLINRPKMAVPVEISPGRQVIALPGKPLRVMVDAKQPLTDCEFVFTNEWSEVNEKLRFNFKGNDTTPEDSNPRETGIEYYGAGMAGGQCGMQVSRATDIYNHGIWVMASTDADHEATNFFRLIVARKPNIPYIFSNTTINSDGITVLNAWCSARSRPQSSLSWFLGGERIPEEHLDFVVANVWTWPSNIRTVEQKLTLTLNSSAFGKDLWCTASHMALQTPKGSRKVKIRAASTPSPPVLEVMSHSLSEGSWLEASCSVYGGQPGVKVTWYMGNNVLRRDGKDDDPQSSTNGRKRLTQKFRHLLKPEDNGQELRCQVTHPALPQPLQETFVIRFTHCPPLSSSTVLISCSLEGGVVDCGTPQQVGTIAKLACKPGYVVAGNTVVYPRVKCMENLKWDRPVLFKCAPNCGIRNTNSGDLLISSGFNSSIGEFSWHVGIYQVISATSIEQICGGTLLTPNIIVSAAHCFHHKGTGRKVDPSLIKVALGKHARAWEEVSPNIQKRNVSQIVVPQTYSGRVTNYASDIAILRITHTVEITGFVNIVCVDWENTNDRKALRAGNNGTVAGWGYIDNFRQSDELKYVDLPFVDQETCEDTLDVHTKPLLTNDKFCAGFLNKNISVCQGDSGGGLVFRDPLTDRYYLRGVVSIAFSPPGESNHCYAQHYTAFTRFSTFISWIRENS